MSTINGDSNVPFYKELGNASLKAKDVPVVAFSVGEEDLRGVDTKPLVGHLAAWNYFQSIKNPTNDEFIAKWSAYAKAKKLPGADKPLTNDPMEATYIGINMWKQAVEKAKSTDVDKVIAAMAGQTFKAPSGIVSKMDEKNHPLHKSVFIGEIKADGQFNVVWKTPGPVKAKPWSPYIEGNAGKPDETCAWVWPTSAPAHRYRPNCSNYSRCSNRCCSSGVGICRADSSNSWLSQGLSRPVPGCLSWTNPPKVFNPASSKTLAMSSELCRTGATWRLCWWSSTTTLRDNWPTIMW